MGDPLGLEDVIEKQCEKLYHLQVATDFTNCRRSINSTLIEVHEKVSQTTNSIEIMRQKLERMKQQNIKCRELLAFLKSLDKKILHIEKNIPAELIQDYKTTEQQPLMELSRNKGWKDRNINHETKENVNSESLPVFVESECQEIYAKDCKKVLFKEPEVCPIIPLIEMDEFKHFPKYIIGRQSLETLNGLLKTINEVLKAKYMLLKMGKAAARKKCQLDLYLHFKKQEVSDDNGYLYFFTAEDYQRHTNMKLDKTKLNLLTALRHSKRLREYRTGNELRYVVVQH